ncbi:hypothetical protein IW262DRAFT_143503 [Armillaria fumosa]|nr:hypothetical protein IW262DRAFT_143503 [Armillaria fumosa]
MLSTCQACGFLSLSDQESASRDHDTISIVPHRPVPLSSTDHRRLQTDIVDLENDIDIIDHQIRRLRASLSDLRRVRKSKKFELARARESSVASIWCLPVEVIVEIIVLAAEGDNGDIYHGVPMVLSHSCRLFRDILLSTPETWSRIYIDDTMRGQGHPFRATHLLQTYLARSKETLLFVSINSSHNIDVILECLAPHHSRLYTLELNICLPGWKSLSWLAVANLPKLTVLHLSVEGIDVSEPMEGPDGVVEALGRWYFALGRSVEAFRHADALRDVHLYGMVFLYFKMPLKQLTRFAGDVSLSKYLLLFRDALELAEADLRLLDPKEPGPWDIVNNRPLWHTRLTRLSLYANIPCLKFIRLPALQYFRIEEIWDTKNGTFKYNVGSDIYIFLRESQCPLETLLLELPPFQLSPLTLILEACATTLTTLSLRIDLVGARVIYNALTFDGVTCLAPHLKDLSLRDDSSSCDLSQDRGDGARSGSLTLRAPYPSRPTETLERLSELEQEGLFSETGGVDGVVRASFHEDFFFRMVQSRCDWSLYRCDGARLRSLTLCAPYSSRPTETLEKLSEWQQEGLAVEFYGYSRVVR